MKTIVTLLAAAMTVLVQTGCSTTASVAGHGVSTRASTSGPGAGVGVRAF